MGSPTLASLRAYLRDDVARNEGTGYAGPPSSAQTARPEQLLLDAMQLRDLVPYAKCDVEGYELDFALLEQGIKLNVEVDGDQHLDARRPTTAPGHYTRPRPAQTRLDSLANTGVAMPRGN